jgi:quinolinate synthase
VHERFSAQEIEDIKKQNPEIVVLTHPECPPEVIAASDFTGSTSGMSKYVKNKQPNKVMLVTECSMSDNVQVDNPNVQFIKPCNLCPHMKTISLPKVLECLEKETNEILIPEIIIKKAQRAVERMVAIGRSH